MNYLKDLPVELTTDYEGNEERMTIRFIKLACSINKNIDAYLQAFQYTIAMGPTLEKKNVIQFIKMMTTNEYFDFKSQFAHNIFQTLVMNSKSGVGQQFQLVTFMLTNEDIQLKYLAALVEYLGKNTEGQLNYSLSLLERLMFNTLNILQGKKKGPPIAIPSIENLLKISVTLASKRELHFLNSVDHCNFLKICATSLEIMRKYSSGDKNHLKTYEQIWKSQIQVFRHLETEVIDCVFGILIELCNFKEIHILEEMEKKQNFDYLVVCSSYHILKCPNINKFWHSFLSKRLNSTMDLQNFDQLSMISLFTYHLYNASSTMEEIIQKLNITDNLILATNLMTASNHIKIIQLQQVDDPKMRQTNLFELTQVSFKALYDPVFKIDKNGIFFQILNKIKIIASNLGQNIYNNINEHIPLLNLLPSLKIVIKKCKNFMDLDEHFETLLKFLMVFLNDDKESKCFEDFVILICEQLRLQLCSSCLFLSKQKIKRCHQLVDLITTNCLDMMQGQAINIKNIGSYIRCLESLVKINKNSSFIKPFKYLQKLVAIILERNKFDPEIYQFMSKLIKQSSAQKQGKTQCFDCLYKLTVDQMRVFYLELLFDFAETHCEDDQIISKMSFRNAEISKVCLFSPDSQNSQLRNLSYILTSQAIRKDLKISDTVLCDLNEIVNNMKYRPKLHKKIISLITKQRHNFNRISKEEKIGFRYLTSFLNILIKMIVIINDDCIESNNQSKLEKNALFQRIANEILRFVLLIGRSRNLKKDLKEHQISQLEAIIESIKRAIEQNQQRNFSRVQKLLKTLMASYIYLETEIGLFLKGEGQRMKQIHTIKQLMRLQTNERSQKMVKVTHLLSAGYACKLFMHFGSDGKANVHKSQL